MAFSLFQGTSTNKFQRTYILQIMGQDGQMYQIGSEDGSALLTMDFNVQRASMASSQQGIFRIKNIPQYIRNVIGKDWFDHSKFYSLIVKAGYVGTPLSTIFNGIVLSTTSYREEGGVDVVTEIEGHDYSLLMANCYSNWTIGTVANPVKQSDIINRLVSDLQVQTTKQKLTLGIGYIGTFNNPAYSFTANGATWDILQEQTSRLSYIDNGKVYCLPNGDSFEGTVSLISSATGLLGTPRRSQNSLTVDMVFEPNLIPGQYIYLDSTLNTLLNSNNNGKYTVTAVQHAGIISNTISGKCKTTAVFLLTGTPYANTFGIPNGQ